MVMSENAEDGSNTVMEKIAEIIQSHDSSSSSSDSDQEQETKQCASAPDASTQPKIFRLFGRERPVHDVLGGGKPADVLLWRDKKSSGAVLGTATIVWVLFEIVEYHLLTLVCHMLILSLATLFLWSNAHTFINKSHRNIPELYLPEEPLLIVASHMTSEINRALALLREIASGKDLKKFLMVVSGLWILSIVGNWCNLLTLIYILFVLMHTLPVFYEKYDHKVDPLAEKATIQMKKQYCAFDEKVLSKIPLPALKAKRG